MRMLRKGSQYPQTQRAQCQRRTWQAVNAVHNAIEPAPAGLTELCSELAKGRSLSRGCAPCPGFGILPKDLGRLTDDVAAPEDQREHAFDQPHAATRARCCASLR